MTFTRAAKCIAQTEKWFQLAKGVRMRERKTERIYCVGIREATAYQRIVTLLEECPFCENFWFDDISQESVKTQSKVPRSKISQTKTSPLSW